MQCSYLLQSHFSVPFLSWKQWEILFYFSLGSYIVFLIKINYHYFNLGSYELYDHLKLMLRPNFLSIYSRIQITFRIFQHEPLYIIKLYYHYCRIKQPELYTIVIKTFLWFCIDVEVFQPTFAIKWHIRPLVY